MQELERDVVALARSWDDELADQLAERSGRARGRLHFEAWARHLPAHYKGYTFPATAAHDKESASAFGPSQAKTSVVPLNAPWSNTPGQSEPLSART